MKSKFNILFEAIMNNLQSTNIKQIYINNSNLPIKLVWNKPHVTILNSYPIKDIIKHSFNTAYFSPTSKAWIIESFTIDEVYNRLIQILNQKNMLKVKEENLKFIQNTTLNDHSITITNIEQQFGKYGRYLLLTGIDQNNITFNLNSNKSTNALFQKIYLTKILYNTLPTNLISIFSGIVTNNNFKGNILITNIQIKNQDDIFNKIRQFIRSIPVKTFDVYLKLFKGHYLREKIRGRNKAQITYVLDKKYPKSIIKDIKEI